METQTLHQQFINLQRQSCIEFLEKAWELIEKNRCITELLTYWEHRLIDELIQFTRIPEHPTRDDLQEEIEFQLECMRRRGKNNPKVTGGELSLFKMVNDFKCEWEDALE